MLLGGHVTSHCDDPWKSCGSCWLSSLASLT